MRGQIGELLVGEGGEGSVWDEVGISLSWWGGGGGFLIKKMNKHEVTK